MDSTYTQPKQGVRPNPLEPPLRTGLTKTTSLKLYTQSSTYTDFTESDEEGKNYLVADEKGFSFVVKCLARDFISDKVRLNSTVTTIKVADDCVCAEVKDGGTYCGNYGIITFSAGVLQAAIRGDKNSVQFEPPLPKWKQDAINSTSVVFYAKISWYSLKGFGMKQTKNRKPLVM